MPGNLPRYFKTGIYLVMLKTGSLVATILSPIIAPIVKVMATTGAGTRLCMKLGCLPVPVHFYQPIPDIKELEQAKVWDRRSDLAGIDFNIDRQLELLGHLGENYGSECMWPAKPTGEAGNFYTENQSFSFGCAAATHCIIRRHQPARVIEIGSGNSSLIISAALERNGIDNARGYDYTIIDPYPKGQLQHVKTPHQVIDKKVQAIDTQTFTALESGDILFIDSSHCVRIGGDVNFLFLEVLPRLKPGVLVHIHDIPLPDEYPKVYVTNPRFRVFWTEAYLLQAFLACNDHFEVMLAMSYIMREYPDRFQQAFGGCDPTKHRLSSSSFWIRRKQKTPS